MAAPSTTVWGDIKGSYGKIGINVSIENKNDLKSYVTITTWFASKYSVTDDNNTYRFDNNATSANTKYEDVSIRTTNNSGSGWSTDNQVLLNTHSVIYDRGSTDKVIYCAAALSGVDKVGSSTMRVSASYTIPKLNTYTIIFNANGGSGAPGAVKKLHGTDITLPTTIPTRSGYTFSGWKSSTNTIYSAGGGFTANVDATLYAVWTSNGYTVSYNANGGSDAPESQTSSTGGSITLSTTIPTRTDYEFLGWSTSSSATSATYTAGSTYSAGTSVTLYAVWKSTYSKPRVTVNSMYRAHPYTWYTPDDFGTCLTINITWEMDKTPSMMWIKYRESGVSSNWNTDSIILDSGYDEDNKPFPNNWTGDMVFLVDASFWENPTEDSEGYLQPEKSYDIEIMITDGGGSTTIQLTSPSVSFSIDFLAGGKGAAFGKPAEIPDYLDINWKTYCRKSISIIGSANIEKALTVKSDIYANGNIYDASSMKVTNGLAVYETGTIDPNTTLDHLILTKHANTPFGTSEFAYIKTEFYNTKSNTTNRMQTAFPYSSTSSPYYRRYHSGSWSDWIPLHAGKADVCSISGSSVTTTTSTAETVAEYSVTEDGVYGVSGNIYWASKSGGYRAVVLRNVNSSGTQIGASIAQDRIQSVPSGALGQTVAGFRRISKGTKIILVATQNSGGDLSIDNYNFDVVKISP